MQVALAMFETSATYTVTQDAYYDWERGLSNAVWEHDMARNINRFVCTILAEYLYKGCSYHTQQHLSGCQCKFRENIRRHYAPAREPESSRPR